MPKTGRMTPGERELAATIRADFAGAYYLTLTQIGKVIGAKSPHTTRDWVAELIPHYRNGRKVWLVSNVAHKLLNNEEAG